MGEGGLGVLGACWPGLAERLALSRSTIYYWVRFGWIRRLSDKSPTFWIQYHADQDRNALPGASGASVTVF